jgi:hypothetical protein
MTPELIDSLQKRFGSADFSRYQVVRAQKYDFVRLATTGASSVSFFSNPIGSSDPSATTVQKTLEQTNLVKNASFGQEYYALTQIRTYANFVAQNRTGMAAVGTNFVFRGYTALLNSAMNKLQQVLNSGVLEISFAQKLYYQIGRPFINCPSGFGIDVQSLASSRTAAAAVVQTQLPRTNWRVSSDIRATSVYNIDPLQIIEPEIQIGAVIKFPDGNTPNFTLSALNSADTSVTPEIELGLIFDGYVIRPSQ